MSEDEAENEDTATREKEDDLRADHHDAIQELCVLRKNIYGLPHDHIDRARVRGDLCACLRAVPVEFSYEDEDDIEAEKSMVTWKSGAWTSYMNLLERVRKECFHLLEKDSSDEDDSDEDFSDDNEANKPISQKQCFQKDYREVVFLCKLHKILGPIRLDLEKRLQNPKHVGKPKITKEDVEEIFTQVNEEENAEIKKHVLALFPWKDDDDDEAEETQSIHDVGKDDPLLNPDKHQMVLRCLGDLRPILRKKPWNFNTLVEAIMRTLSDWDFEIRHHAPSILFQLGYMDDVSALQHTGNTSDTSNRNKEKTAKPVEEHTSAAAERRYDDSGKVLKRIDWTEKETNCVVLDILEDHDLFGSWREIKVRHGKTLALRSTVMIKDRIKHLLRHSNAETLEEKIKALEQFMEGQKQKQNRKRAREFMQ